MVDISSKVRDMVEDIHSIINKDMANKGMASKDMVKEDTANTTKAMDSTTRAMVSNILKVMDNKASNTAGTTNNNHNLHSNGLYHNNLRRHQ